MISAYSYFNLGKKVSYGIVSGTRIGYIYMYDCSDGTGDSLYLAAKSLIQDSGAKGIILDIRLNFGGTFAAFEKAYTYLSEGDVSWIGYGERLNPRNRLAMVNDADPAYYDVHDDIPGVHGVPIAILCGPNTVSAGDVLPVLFKHNQHVRTFGESTAGAFGGRISIMLPDTVHYGATEQFGNFYEVSNPTKYLSHNEFPIDTPVWIDRLSVCNGVDNVARKAIEWINSQVVFVLDKGSAAPYYSVYPNPTQGMISIEINSPIANKLSLRLYSCLGTEIWSSPKTISNGISRLALNLSHLHVPGGYYFLDLIGPTAVIARQPLLILK